MLFFGHVASGTMAARWASPRADLRWVIFFSLLADVIDKPIGLILFRETVNNGRIYFHSLLVNLALTGLLMLARKPLVYTLSLWVHQLCDLMWTRPWVALWPITGSLGYRDIPFEQWAWSVFSPYNVTTEVLGMGVLMVVIARHRLASAERIPNQQPTAGGDAKASSTAMGLLS